MNLPQFTTYYNFNSDKKSVEDFDWLFNTYKGYMYTRLLQMFKYNNLPDSIPSEMLEYYLLSSGTCFITKIDEKLYAFQGGLGGELDVYYRPTLYTIANPALKISKSFEIEKDGVLMRNDKMWLGLDKLFTRYAHLMSTNIISMNLVDIMLRCISLLSAPDDKSKKSAEEFLKKLKEGSLGVIGENPFFEGIKMQSLPANNGSYLTQFIELHQYYKGSFYNEVGLNANFNMKREAIGKGEASLSEDSLLPLCDTMLECRKEDVKKINEMFGTNITVEYNSVWKQNQEENLLEIRKLEVESSQLEESEINENVKEEGKINKGDFGIDSNDSGDGNTGKEESGNQVEEETRRTSIINEDDERGTEQTSNNNLSDDEQETGNENTEQNSEESDIIINNNIIIESDKENVKEEESNSEDKGDNVSN